MSLGNTGQYLKHAYSTINSASWFVCRYKYGMFKQGLGQNGQQLEMPDIWLSNGNPWEIVRPEVTYKIGFYGSVDNFKWTPAEVVQPCWSHKYHEASTKE